jgi:hypothetical protein
MERVMLNEDEVNRAVKLFLEERGWISVRALAGREHGVDVEGQHPSGARRVQVESKGGTSGHANSRRHGQTFDSSQVTSHVARAVFAALRLRERSRGNTILIALPDDSPHQSCVEGVSGALKALGVALLAVSEGGVRVVHGTADPDPGSPR